jgi:hypothetical protein
MESSFALDETSIEGNSRRSEQLPTLGKAPAQDDRETELSWLESIEIYETLDSSGMDSVGFREFCTLVFAVAAVQSQQTLQCLYEHGVLFFDVLSGG